MRLLATTLNDLEILDSDQNRKEKTWKEFEEALRTCRELAHKEPEIYLRYAALALNNLSISGSRAEPSRGGAESI
jgi:hypothetical protein